jgi:hypothetical protein
MPVQNHIHLSTTVNVVGDKAPTLTWVTMDRVEVPSVIASIDRALTGELITQHLSKDGEIVRFYDFTYVIRVQADDTYTLQERIDQLQALHGETAYLCDHFHANTGSDHTADIKQVYVASIGRFPADYKQLFRFEVEVSLVDDTFSSSDPVVSKLGYSVVLSDGRRVVA